MPTTTLLARILFAVTLGLPIAPSPAHSAATDSIGFITTLEGKAYVAREGQAKPLLLHGQDEVLIHDVIETQSHSRLKILFHDDSLLTLAENSRMTIRSYASGGRTPSRLVVQLDRGAMRNAIGGHQSSAESKFEVQTPFATIAAREAYFTVWIDEGIPALLQETEQSAGSTNGRPFGGPLGPPAVSLGQVGLANIGDVGSVTLTSGGETLLLNPGQYVTARPNMGFVPPSTWTGTPPFPIATIIAATDLKAFPKLETPKETLRLVGGTAD
ncbi:MAG TPA: FecR family protein, partial [Nitrospiraceae bacterium]|nr:FecR family protein [Nitrospiraceae bacterium]